MRKGLALVAYYGLPEEVQFCSRCVISNQRPSSTVEFKHAVDDKKQTIHFDEEGVCAACRYQEIKESAIDWAERERELIALCDRSRRPSGYDVVVPGSGGKDSAFTAHILKYKYGLNPLTVTWAPHLFTDIGFRNFQNWMHVGGLDNILFTPNGRLHRYLTSLAFRNLVHPFQPFIVGQRIVGPMIAARFGIPLVVYGENQAEYGNQLSENGSPRMSDAFFSHSNLESMLLGGTPAPAIMAAGGFNEKDLTPYLPVSPQTVALSQIEVHYLGYYLRWDPQECFYYAAENTGFAPNPQRTEGSYSKYSSIDDRIDPFHYFTTLVKFGIGRATYDAAQEIRNGKITRAEGVQLVRRFDTEFPSKYFADFLDYIGIDEDGFWKVIDAARSPHLWRKVGDEWALRSPVWEA